VKRAIVSGGPYTAIASGLASTGYTDTGVTNGTTYFYVVTASNLGGESGVSNQASATPLPPPPAAPTGLTATPGNAQVTLTWSASATATTYSVKRTTVSGGPYTAIASGLTSTSYTNTGLTNGTTYFYVVTASNLGGESGVSNQASATPVPPPPAAPTGLAASPGNAQVTLTWQASATATSYSVKRSTASGGPFATVATGLVALTYTDTGLTNGTKYYYIVTASNLGGESGASNKVNTTPQGPPAAPSGLALSSIAKTSIKLNWIDNSNNETGFKIERSTDGTNFSQIATAGAGATSYSSGGLARNTIYYYRVRAYNSAGDSAYSNITSARTLP
jgi:cellulose 1,4-beta-cellobiosidase